MNVTVEIERRDSDPAKPEWVCPSCKQAARARRGAANLMVCPHCGFHLRIGARERIRQLVDDGTFRELWSSVLALDPLKFTDLETYPERVREAQAKTGLNEAIVTGTATIDGTQCVLAVMDFGFMGGSMGSVVGEKLWRSAELAAGEDLPLVAVCSSGGARMQEGILSLMQMAKTSCAVDLINEATSPFVTDPCRPVHRRRGRELRDAGRHLHRRAGSAALLHRTARDRRDHPRGAAARASAAPSAISCSAISTPSWRARTCA